MSKIKGKKIKNNSENSEYSITSGNLKKAKDKIKEEKVVQEISSVKVKKIRKRKINNGEEEKKVRIDKTVDIKDSDIDSFDDKEIDLEDNIDIDNDDEKDLDDKEIDLEDNLSIGIIVLILISCILIGVVLGYILYRLALNSSAIILIKSLLK